jgi:osmotically-inducible protein OsmY
MLSMLIESQTGTEMNQVIMNVSKSGLTVIACVFLAACAPSSERRSFGTVIDDQSSEVKALDVIFSRDEFDNKDHIKVEMHNGTLLLIGETQSESNKALATELTIAMKNVDNVVNELAVMPSATAGELLDNTWMTSKVNTVLTTENPVKGFDATRIKVLSARDHIYLMGTLSRADGEAVAEVVRNIGGVEKVIKVFDYID